MNTRQNLIRTMAGIASDGGLITIYEKMKTWRLASQIRILDYHRVSPERASWTRSVPVHPVLFEWQLGYIKSRFHVMGLDELIDYLVNDRTLPPKGTIVTFDDGYKDNYLYAVPLLKKYEIPATFFLTTGPIENGGLHWFDELAYRIRHSRPAILEIEGFGVLSLGPRQREREAAVSCVMRYLRRLPPKARDRVLADIRRQTEVAIPGDLSRRVMLTWEEARDMIRAGFRIGAHTVTHAVLTAGSSEEAKIEISESKKIIENRLQLDVRTFSYPFGQYNAEIIEAVKASGCQAAVTTVPKFVDRRTDPCKLGRILPGWDPKSFRLFASGLFSDIYSAYELVRFPLGQR
jgi:peptidoglycan/xylan/chitin deacetylase (PgdA/CDA1 family)